MKICSLAIDSEKQLIKDIIINKNVDFADKTVNYIINNLKLGKVNKKVLVFRERLLKPIDQYHKTIPHVVAAKKIIDRGEKIEFGEIVPYYIAKGSGPIAQRAEPYVYFPNFELPDPDVEYYIEKFLKPMRENLFKATGLIESNHNWYYYYLKTFHWFKLRYKALEYANHKCQVCSSFENLEVHHNTYENLWNEPLSDLIVLCSKHHQLIHLKGEIRWHVEKSLPQSV